MQPHTPTDVQSGEMENRKKKMESLIIKPFVDYTMHTQTPHTESTDYCVYFSS